MSEPMGLIIGVILLGFLGVVLISFQVRFSSLRSSLASPSPEPSSVAKKRAKQIKDVPVPQSGETRQNIDPEFVHRYTFDLASGQFLGAAVEQEGVDVTVTLSGPGRTLHPIDSRSEDRGPEDIRLFAWAPCQASKWWLSSSSAKQARTSGWAAPRDFRPTRRVFQRLDAVEHEESSFFPDQPGEPGAAVVQRAGSGVRVTEEAEGIVDERLGGGDSVRCALAVERPAQHPRGPTPAVGGHAVNPVTAATSLAVPQGPPSVALDFSPGRRCRRDLTPTPLLKERGFEFVELSCWSLPLL